MNSNVDNWYPELDNLIRVVKQYPIIYNKDLRPKTTREYKTALKIVWDEIESKLSKPKRSCQQTWKYMIFRYAKLKILFNSGKLPQEDVNSFIEKSRYFDGTLSFLDAYISDITEAMIPPHIHNKINKMFDLPHTQDNCKFSTPVVTHEQIIRTLVNKANKDSSDSTDMQHLHNLLENVVKRKLNELFSLNIISDSDSDSQTSNKEIDLGLQSELIIDEDIKEETDSKTEDCMQTESNTENVKTESEINIKNEFERNGGFNLSNNKLIATSSEDTLYNTIVDGDVNVMITEDETKRTSNVTSRISDINMKKFFNEMGEVMSVELSKEKQLLLKGRINALLRNISEEESERIGLPY